MPEKPQIDPYGFVPLVGPPRRDQPVGHHRFGDRNHHGELTCRLTVHTPLFVYDPRFARPVGGGHEEAKFPVSGRVAIIPATSLKGIIRSLFEAAEPSCFTLPHDWDENGRRTYRGSGITRGQTVTVALPQAFKHCDNRDRLCPACRVFGSLDPNGKWALAGKVSISDAQAKPGEFTLLPLSTLGVLSTPKPEARQGAYLLPGHVVKGRKFYRHRLDGVITSERRDRLTKTVQPVAPGSIFYFTVDYQDLSEDELRPFLYALALEEGLWHKIGMGKPIGLGSAQIEILRWARRDVRARYRALGAGVETALEGETLTRELDAWLRPYRSTRGQPDEPAHLKALRQILRHEHDYDVRYPGGPPPVQPRRR